MIEETERLDLDQPTRAARNNQSHPLTVTRVTDPARLPALAEAWGRLEDANRPGEVFRSGAWLVPWWKHFSNGKDLCVYVASVGSRMVGALPGYRTRTMVGGRCFRLLGDGVVTSDYLGIVARAEDLAAASEAIGRAALVNEEEIVLDGLDATDPLVRVLMRAGARRGLRRDRAWAIAVPVVRRLGGLRGVVEGAPPCEPRPPTEAPAAGAPRGLPHRDSAGRAGRGERAVRALAASPAALAGEGGSSALTSPPVERFHQEAGRALARRGWAAIHVMHVEGAPRAARYVFEHGGRAYDYQSGRDPAWEKRSVGSVLLDAMIEDAFARGLTELDFLRGPEPFKALYTDQRRAIVGVHVASSARARASFTVRRGWDVACRTARRVLSPDARAHLRRREAQLRRWLGSKG